MATKLPTRLARLTLYSGTNCSLCDVAKAELAKIKQKRNFELDIVNIRDPGQERWRKKYANWIPALHIDGREVAKGRWDGQTVIQALDLWQKNECGTQEDNPKKQQCYSSSDPHLSSPPTYERCTSDVLGDEKEDESPLDEGGSHCFNCGSTYHVVASCLAPHNTKLIALSRQMYNFFKLSRPAEQMTLSAAAEFKHQRRRWIESFEPGRVRDPFYAKLSNMADWGYPSGWFSEADPQERILRRIDDLSVATLDPAEGEHPFAIFGDDDAVEVLDIGTDDFVRLDGASQGPRRRWAMYPRTYFSSDILRVTAENIDRKATHIPTEHGAV
ncbi:hypothetical protein F5148DRAFT_1149005 [Russula earlei]|uniref:Uncharacterized protein n=1 Tax=Russula earlei TaxID=71964 RepID=A0ACC0UB30_9AGAM|nr:hypothetical protein F5148DRAFT_1149005 [Russula earlei]